MRRIAALLALFAVSLILACSGPTHTPGPKKVAWGGEVPQSTELAGREVKETASGPWTVRKTAAGGGEDSGRSWGAESDALGERSTLDSAAPAESAPPAPGAAAPTSGDYDGGYADDPGMEPVADAGPAKEDDHSVAHGGGARPERQQSGSPLKAGTTDDNAQYADFLKFLAEWGDREDTAGLYDELDVADRVYIRVVNQAGKVVPAAAVQVVDLGFDRIALTGTTYGDGRVPFYPHLDAEQNVTVASAAPRYMVEVNAGLARRQVEWDGAGDLTVKVDLEKPVSDPIALDVLFLIDTTGSMSDEIQRIKASLLSMTEKLRSMEREFDLRYAAVLYRDIGDEYVTMSHPFTGDVAAFDSALATIEAGGGGDGPESLNQGLAEAVGRADWREGAAKVMFLIADASPHMDYDGDVPYGQALKAALAKGIRIHSVAASGLEPVGSLVFRQIAQFTRGKFIFIEYGSVAAAAKSHGVTGEVKSNNLDDILFEQIREEVARWGRPE